MNIFYLHPQPYMCAIMHNDKHCVKMIVETAQILSTVHHVYESDNLEQYYKPTHKNHPSTRWAGESIRNYQWLWRLLFELCLEYTHRYGKSHKVVWSGLLQTLHEPPIDIPNAIFTEPPQAMPDDCKMTNTVEAYRKYYMVHKSHIAKWTNRDKPFWVS